MEGINGMSLISSSHALHTHRLTGTIFAYGQTSSGKTFTMKGNSETPGITPLAISDIFSHIENVCAYFMMFIYLFQVIKLIT